MKTILDLIIEERKRSIEQKKSKLSLDKLINQPLPDRPKDFFINSISVKNRINIIGELKRASPLSGILVEDFDILDIVKQFIDGGVSAISVLTEEKYFLGNISYLRTVAEIVNVPILCKDFIIDEYQIYEAKLNRADAVLLIKSILSEEKLNKFLELCEKLNLSALVEIHNEEELRSVLNTKSKIIGINNRNLKDFQINIKTTLKLRPMIPEDRIVVSESGINTREQIIELKNIGVNAVLIGTSLMRSKNIVEKLKELTL